MLAKFDDHCIIQLSKEELGFMNYSRLYQALVFIQALADILELLRYEMTLKSLNAVRYMLNKTKVPQLEVNFHSEIEIFSQT